MHDDTSYFVVGGGAVALQYSGMNKVSERHFPYPWTIHKKNVEDEQYYILISSNMLMIYDNRLSTIFSIDYDAPSTIAYVDIGEYDSDEGSLDVLVVREIPEDYVFIDVYHLDGEYVWGLDNVDLLGKNLTIVLMGEAIPGTENASLILKSTTNDTYYFAVLDIQTKNIDITLSLDAEPDIVRVCDFGGEYRWLLSGYWWGRIYLVDQNGVLAAIKELPYRLVIDVYTSDMNNDEYDEVVVFAYDISWNNYVAIMYDSHLVEQYEIDSIQSMPEVKDILSYYEGYEIAAVRNVWGNYYLEIYSWNGTIVFSDTIEGRKRYDTVLSWVDAEYTGNPLLVVVSSYGDSATLYILTDEEDVEGYKCHLHLDDAAFLPYGVVLSPERNRVGKVFILDESGALTISDLYVYFDDMEPVVSLSESTLTYISIFDVYVLPGEYGWIVVNATDDAQLSNLTVEMVYYDKSGKTLDISQTTYYLHEKTSAVNVSIEAPAQTYNMTVDVQVNDIVGRNSTLNLQVFVDISKPEIHLITPSKIQMSGDIVHIYAYIWDDLWISQAYIIVNDRTVPMIQETPTTEPGKTILYHAELSREVLQSGENTVTIYVKDFAGRTETISLVVEVPEVYITETEGGIPYYIWLIMGIPIGVSLAIATPPIIRFIRGRIIEKSEKQANSERI